jgi:hypothetical protein
MFPFVVPVVFPSGIPAIVFAAMAGIFLSLIFTLFEKKES